MSVRFASVFATMVAASVLIARTSAAQPSKPTSALQPSTSPSTPVVQILKTQGTPEEKPQIDAITARLKTRLTTDATVTKRLDDALAKGDLATSRAVFAEIAQLKPDQVFIGSKLVSSLVRPDLPVLRLASMERFNPFVIAIAYKGIAICFGSEAECVAALRAAKASI